MRAIVLIALLALVTGGFVMPGCETDEVADEWPDEGIDFESFYGVCPELEAELEQIVLADPAVQFLLEGKDYSFTVDGHTIEGQDYDLSVGVRLNDDVTPEEFNAWMDGGRQDSSLIKEYVGILNIGYNDKYYLTIDREEGLVVEMQFEGGHGGIPEVTAEEKQRAVEIALADNIVQQLLAGKEYEIAPDNSIGVWHTGDIKLGVAFEIDFDKPYFIDMDLPRYQSAPFHVSDEVQGLIISVLLEENRVASILPK